MFLFVSTILLILYIYFLLKDKNLFKAQSPALLSTEEAEDSSAREGHTIRESLVARNQTQKPVTRSLDTTTSDN